MATTYTLQAPMPAIAIAGGMKVKLEAISPTTGGPVTGVTATAWAIYGESLGDTAPPEKVATLPPLLTYKPGTT